MRLIDLFNTLKSRDQMAQLAADLARRSQADVSATIGSRVQRMGIAEARGYVRARARGVLESHLDVLLRQPNLFKPGLRATLIEDALERTIIWVVGQKLKTEPVRQQRLAA